MHKFYTNLCLVVERPAKHRHSQGLFTLFVERLIDTLHSVKFTFVGSDTEKINLI